MMPILSSLVAPEVVTTKICSDASDDKVGITIAIFLACIDWLQIYRKPAAPLDFDNTSP